jgi:hypothetical protein
MLRLEGAGGMVLYDQPFARILAGQPFHDRLTVSRGETFAIAFCPVADGTETDRIPAALARVEAIAGEILPLLAGLPKPVRERLQLPDSDSWWRIVFHLAWHFPRSFLKATRRRLLATDGVPAGVSDETFVQLHGMGGRSDLLPGLIYSALEHDLCTCSEAAIAVILDALGKHGQAAAPTWPEAEQRRAFDQLRAEFETGTQMPMGLECNLLKLADSFESPPVTEWAGLEAGGCVERFLILSKLNDQQEIIQIRGPATTWFCQVAERAGNALSPSIPDHPILFDDPQRGFGGPRPVMNRNACERWLGFVFATIKQHAPEALRVTWGTRMGPLSYGFATLERDLCAASVLAIDLAQLTTAAAEAANRGRATCSPFTVPSMEEQGFECPDATPPPTPPASYTLGQLIEYLRQFGQDYHRAADQMREEHPITAKRSRMQLGAQVSGARACLLAIPGFTELREWARSNWGEELGFTTGRRIVDTLVERSRGRLSSDAAEGLSLPEAVARLSALPDAVLEEDEVHLSRTNLPAPIDREARQRVIDALENWKRVIYAPPNEKPTLQEHVGLTNRIVAWRDRHAPHIDATPLDEVRRILVRRDAGEATPEEDLRTAGERATRACDRIKDWLQTIELSLTSAIDSLLAFIDAYLAIPPRQRAPFDISQFEALDRAVYVEAVRLGLSGEVPPPGLRTFGKMHMPGGPGTMRDPPGYFYPMPSKIAGWRSAMLALRALAEAKDREEVAKPTAAVKPGSDTLLALLRVFTNGIADDRIEKATRLLSDAQLTANEKLTKIDALIPIPATASAEQLGEMLGVTKQAVLKTDWWMQNRKGEKENEVGRRREGHRKRAKSYEAPGLDEDDE